MLLAFFLIVPSVMILCSVLVHAIASHFGLRLKYGALAFCCAASIAITLTALKTSAFIDRMFFIKLGALVLIASLLSTFLNRYLTGRDPKPIEPAEESEEVRADEPVAERIETPSNEADAMKRRIEEIKSRNAKNDGWKIEIATPQSKSRHKDASDKKIVEKKVDTKKTVEKIELKTSSVEKKSEAAASRSVEKVDSKIADAVAEQAAGLVSANEKISAVIDRNKSVKKSEGMRGKSAIDGLTIKSSRTDPKGTKIGASNVVKDNTSTRQSSPGNTSTVDELKENKFKRNAVDDSKDGNPKRSEEKTPPKDRSASKISSDSTVKSSSGSLIGKSTATRSEARPSLGNSVEDRSPLRSRIFTDTRPPLRVSSDSRPALEPGLNDSDLAAVEEHLKSLDDILEFAYSQKNGGNFKLSIYAYQRALERYRADDYAPFIAIDLSALYKEQAAYTKAIKVCEDALSLPAVMRNSAARKECTQNLSYLRIVQSVLSKHRVLATPFSKISRQLRAEIDAEFKKQSVFSAV